MSELRFWHDGELLLAVQDPSLLELLRAPLQQAERAEEQEMQASAYSLSFVSAEGEESNLLPLSFLDTVPPIYQEFILTAEGWYRCSGVRPILDCLIEQQQSTHLAEDLEFLGAYGWEMYYQVSDFQLRLPDRLLHAAGERPAPLYWEIANILSQQVGLDIAGALGQQVDVAIYRMKTPLPEPFGPNRTHGRAVVVHLDGKRIGAWLTIGQYFACSLHGTSFDTLMGTDYRDWVSLLADRESPVDHQLAELTPEDVIAEYVAAINRKDYLKAHQLESRGYLLENSLHNVQDGVLYRERYAEEENLRSSFFGSCKSISLLWSKREVGLSYEQSENTRIYYVELEIEPEPDGQLAGPPCFIHLIKETEETGWRVRGMSTSP